MHEASVMTGIRRRAPELTLLVVALVVFVGRLGSMDIWGKREQRATAEALDTVDHDNWLYAYIQCRPRLEKPPLPRWTIATLMKTTGIQDEWIVRFPSAITAVMMVGLVYGLGRRMAGRSVGLASGLALCSTVFFVIESRQAGNDGPLAFFTTLALYAAFRRLHGVAADAPCGFPGDRLGSKGWSFLAWVAMGLGFLSKGPVAMILPALAVVPYLLLAKRFRVGMKALFSGWGVLAFLVLSLSWPVLVYMSDPKAAEIWILEMGQKAGTAGITHHKQRYLITDWPWMTAPWTLLAMWAVILPFLARGREERPMIWFPWFWAVGNMAMFCVWSVAKPNYYVPCEPGVALLVGLAWVRICAMARETGSTAAARSKRFLQVHWLVLGVMAVAAPVFAPSIAKTIAPPLAGTILPWTMLVSAAVLAGVFVSVLAWKRGRDVLSLAGLVGGISCGLLIVYAELAPKLNASRSHRALAAQLDRVLPADLGTVMFYRELDEGLWYYLKGRTLKSIPNSTPQYNKGYDLVTASKENRLVYQEAERIRLERALFVGWLSEDAHESPYVLIRARVYNWFSPGMEEWVEPVYTETGMDRNELMLLRIKDRTAIAKSKAGATR